ncbi:CYTH and CHAD domain-containing protein [Methylocystis sp. MJC1]|jgi:inorganic triphosphatase YgiF|uniref:CYTH and CHAD domain-containing protein n=1 Tax=Methylocystis sp. MJC1 TaxID=2654282 RepID=UPI0013EDDDC1|nr:CYTH and CHAD domain-containing protein [Methylocystis sp. MJC1]KAF2992312.1 Inorganic triphosphatase [Methylocystis sp. MJC1]MBU6527450.1 CYTH and CHAD domain-containing protein [Methylocystis sp. MJC1]UZX10397.1 CYTH and CHAD domain-containing protein [Methylocystis sp. MJC1]
MANGVESELKFLFSPEALPAVRTALRRDAKGSVERKRLVSHYFDTADDYLWRRAITLRIRNDGDESTQTIKREKPSALERDEFETETKSNAPDLAAIQDAPLSRLFKKSKVRNGLRCNLNVEVERETSTVMLDRSEIETALDIGEIESNGHALHFSELELELKRGSRDALFELASALCAGAPITLSLVSKAERGHLLAAGAWGRAFKGHLPQLKKRMNCAEAFELVCHACLHDFLLNLQALRGADRVEAVHQGRVALRRLRAALQLFKPIVEDPDYERLDDELKWIAHVFGEARDLDVFQESAFEPAARGGACPGARQLADLTEARRNEAHDAANAAVDSARLRLIVVDLAAWIENGSWRQPERIDWRQPIGRFASDALRKRLRKFVESARNLPDLDPAQQHKVRIKSKKLRYMAGFFKNAPRLVSERKPLRRLLQRLEQMQNCLGLLHDEQAKVEFLTQEIGRLPPGTDPMVAYAAGRIAQPSAGADERLALAVDAYRDVARMRPF